MAASRSQLFLRYLRCLLLNALPCPGAERWRERPNISNGRRILTRASLRDGFGITGAAKAWKVRLLFSRQLATYLKERVWHPSQQLRERRDGRLEMRLETTGHKDLVRWILSWMPEVKVLAPVELKTRIISKLKEGLKEQGPQIH
jgi:predicted DNA-binding transcriptional regulator YafY